MNSIARCVHNNADLYASIFSAHGVACMRTDRVWITLEEPPPYYSHMLLLDITAHQQLLSEVHVLRRLRQKPFTFKDGFNVVDGASLSFELLFSANWIARTAPAGKAPWSRITTARQLAAWEQAWAKTSPATMRVFPEQVLSDPALAFFGKAQGSAFLGGCIVNHSPDCVGLSNVFGRSHEAAAVCAASLANGKPVVSYERGQDLEKACAAEFERVGALNIWTVG